MGRLLGAGMRRCLDEAELQLAGTPQHALICKPMDEDAQPSAIHKVQTWP